MRFKLLNVCGVYAIESPSGKIYVGSARLVRRRWHQHKITLRACTHRNYRLQNAWNKYGERQMMFRLVLVCLEDDRLLYEQLLIDGLRPYYNLAGTSNATRWSPEARNQAALRQIGKKHSLQTRAKMSKSRTGREVSAETRFKLAAQSWKHTEEAKAKMRGRKFSDEHRRKLSESRKGNKNRLGGKKFLASNFEVNIT